MFLRAWREYGKRFFISRWFSKYKYYGHQCVAYAYETTYTIESRDTVVSAVLFETEKEANLWAAE